RVPSAVYGANQRVLATIVQKSPSACSTTKTPGGSSAFDSLLADPPDVFLPVAFVLRMGDCKFVITEILDTRTEVNVIVRFGIQHRIDGRNVRHGNRTGRNAGVLVSVVRRFCKQVPVQHASDLNSKVVVVSFDGVDYRGICFELHAFLEPVQVNAGHARTFVNFYRLFVYDGGESRNLEWRKSECGCFVQSGLRPEFAVFLFHAIAELKGRSIPEKLVRIRNKHTKDVIARELVMGQKAFVVERFEQRYTVGFDLSGNASGQILEAFLIVKRNSYRYRLPQRTDQIVAVHALF